MAFRSVLGRLRGLETVLPELLADVLADVLDDVLAAVEEADEAERLLELADWDLAARGTLVGLLILEGDLFFESVILARSGV